MVSENIGEGKKAIDDSGLKMDLDVTPGINIVHKR